jgi:hypothetical protein
VSAIDVAVGAADAWVDVAPVLPSVLSGSDVTTLLLHLQKKKLGQWTNAQVSIFKYWLSIQVRWPILLRKGRSFIQLAPVCLCYKGKPFLSIWKKVVTLRDPLAIKGFVRLSF